MPSNCSTPPRSEAKRKQIGHHVDGHRLVPDRVQQPGEPSVVLVGQGQDHVVHGVRVQHRPQVLVTSEPADAARPVPLVARRRPAPGCRRPADPACGSTTVAASSPVPDHDRVAQVVAAAPREAERLAEDGAREPHDRDGEEPEVDDDHARVVVAPEEERHDRHQHRARPCSRPWRGRSPRRGGSRCGAAGTGRTRGTTRSTPRGWAGASAGSRRSGARRRRAAAGPRCRSGPSTRAPSSRRPAPGRSTSMACSSSRE